MKFRSFAAVGSLATLLFLAPTLARAADAETKAAPAAESVAKDAAAADPAATATPAPADDDASLAARDEADAEALLGFRGGDQGIYIGSGVLVAVLVILLVILLLR